MLPTIRFISVRRPGVHGIGVEQNGQARRYYQPFLSRSLDKPDSRINCAIPLTERFIVAGSTVGHLAVIDLDTDLVVSRGKVRHALTFLGLSVDASHLYAQDNGNLTVLDTRTFAVVQSWSLIERVGDSWVQYSRTTDASFGRDPSQGRTIESLHLVEAVSQFDDGKLGTRFNKLKGHRRGFEKGSSGSYVFDIATGAIEYHDDVEAAFRSRRIVRSPGADHAVVAWDTVFLPECREMDEVVFRETTTPIAVADSGSDAAISAVLDLAERMERDLAALTWNGDIFVRFVLDGQWLDEEAFFDRFVQENWIEGVPALRRLMLAYLNHIRGGEGGMPWQADGQATQPLRALVLLDPKSQDVYRLFIEKGDPEHDHDPYTLYEEYTSHHGIMEEADLRFGIYVTIMGFEVVAIDTDDVLRAAEDLVTPERFADITIEEAARRDERFWSEAGQSYIEYLAGDGGSTSAFTQDVITALQSRL